MSEYVTNQEHPHLGGNMKGGDPACWCPEVWQWVVAQYAPRAVLDVGCGTGDALRWFAGRNVQAIGVDGLRENAIASDRPVITHDLTRGPIDIANIDLVWCCEVVEHVRAEFLDNLLSAICCGRVLAMTHAVPGQGGYHHVNERSAEYWINAIESRGFKLNVPASHGARALIRDRKNYFAASGLIFERT